MGERFNLFRPEGKEKEPDFLFPFRTIQKLGPKEFQQDYYEGRVVTRNGERIQLNAVADGHGENGELFAEIATKGVLNGIQNYSSEIGDEEFEKIFENADEETRKIPGSERNEVGFGGTTMSVVILNNKEIRGAYVGDSEVGLVGTHGIVTKLTPPHNVKDDSELIRVVSNHGKVEQGSVLVKGYHLSMTRALGDHQFRPHVISKPSTFGLHIQPSDKYLLVASDGFWNVGKGFKREEPALGTLLAEAKSLDDAKERLEEFINNRRQVDNITVQIIELNKKSSA